MGIIENAMRSGVWGKPFSPTPDWIEWVHIQTGETHCDTCLKLNKCWFDANIMPKLPQHPFCHCAKKDLDYALVQKNARATSAYSKFDPYLFNPDNFYKHQKQKMFESWGYTIEDAVWLQTEMEKQALQKYISGNYTLRQLNEQGQRINIRIEIPRKDKSGTVSFESGWMVRKKGEITLNTPYADH